jgi:hypothetical protein
MLHFFYLGNLVSSGILLRTLSSTVFTIISCIIIIYLIKPNKDEKTIAASLIIVAALLLVIRIFASYKRHLQLKSDMPLK